MGSGTPSVVIALSLIMTIVINKAVDVAMRKKEERELQEQYNKRFPGRVYVPSADKEKKEKQAAKEAPAQGKGTRQSMRGLKSKGADGKENKAAEDGKDKDKK